MESAGEREEQRLSVTPDPTQTPLNCPIAVGRTASTSFLPLLL